VALFKHGRGVRDREGAVAPPESRNELENNDISDEEWSQFPNKLHQ